MSRLIRAILIIRSRLPSKPTRQYDLRRLSPLLLAPSVSANQSCGCVDVADEKWLFYGPFLEDTRPSCKMRLATKVGKCVPLLLCKIACRC